MAIPGAVDPPDAPLLHETDRLPGSVATDPEGAFRLATLLLTRSRHELSDQRVP